MTVYPATATSRADPAARPAPKTAPNVAGASGAFAQTLSATETAGVEAEAAGESAPGFVHQHSRSGDLKPLQKFESFVLRTFVENMLPSENSSFFGTGTAGQIWKSMLAERIGDEMAASGGIGIADLLKDHQPSLKAMAGSAATLDAAGLKKTSTR